MSTIFFLLLVLSSFHAISAAENYKTTSSAKINGLTAEQVWPYIADFCNLYLIFPSDVSFCTEGIDGQPGQIRYSSGKIPSPTQINSTFVFYTREELIKVDETKRFLTYQMHENNRGINYLKATMQVLPVASGCIFKFTVVQAPVGDQTYQEFVEGLAVLTANIVSLIQNLF